ncbi:MAG TPA: hypothetical protein VNW92_23240 [Polyangiaceae bacterium]|nr:hypothetical protein [Polyangiaceae bacterium]
MVWHRFVEHSYDPAATGEPIECSPEIRDIAIRYDHGDSSTHVHSDDAALTEHCPREFIDGERRLGAPKSLEDQSLGGPWTATHWTDSAERVIRMRCMR